MDIMSYLLGKKSGGGSGDLDWESIGYSGTPQSIVDGYNYAKYIQDNWTSSSYLRDYKEVVICPMIDISEKTSTRNFARNCYKLMEVPLLDTSNVTNMAGMFDGCYALTKIPILDTGKVTSIADMFRNCNSLNDESLDNILQMCIGATSYKQTKTLVALGFNASYYLASRIQALPHYQDFIDEGWAIGY